MNLVLGVDGGGSKTHAAVADDEGRLLGFATNGPSNWETVGLRGAADSLRDAAVKALSPGLAMMRSPICRPLRTSRRSP